MDTIKVKAKPGFNIVVKDLGLSLRSETKDWIEVDKEKFNASVDVRSVRKLILIEGEDTVAETTVAEEKKEVEAKVTGEGAFVMAGPDEKKPEGIFVAQPKTSPEANTTAILDQAPVPAPKAKVLDETEVVEPVAETVAEVKETVVEAKEVKEETNKSEKSKAETKPATKKPATRTKADKKTK